MTTRIERIGGSFAPPLSEDLLSDYYQEIVKVPEESQLGDYLRTLLKCCNAWWELPESEAIDTEPHPSGRGTVVKLAQEYQERLFDLIPWMEELNTMGNVFEQIPPTDRLRNIAFHLLWHVKELCLDREPITSDKL